MRKFSFMPLVAVTLCIFLAIAAWQSIQLSALRKQARALREEASIVFAQQLPVREHGLQAGGEINRPAA